MLSASEWLSQSKLIACPGPTGPQGNPGTNGTSGATGSTGTSGPTGPSGVTGPSGPSGPSGPTGSTGPSGPSGATGPSGAGVYPLNQVINLIAPVSGKTLTLSNNGTNTFTNDNTVAPGASGEIWFLSARGFLDLTAGTIGTNDVVDIRLQCSGANAITVISQTFYGKNIESTGWSISGYMKSNDTTNFVVFVDWQIADGSALVTATCNGFCATKIS